MASDLLRTLTLWGVTAGLILGAAPSALRAATGDPIIEFRSALATTPEEQGWTHEGRSLNSECPKSKGYAPCWFQGSQDLNADTWPDNNCLPGIGCHKPTEHYNAPDPTQAGSSTYTEWVAFDNGNSGGQRPLVIPDSTVTHSPPWGAPTFLNAPGYPVLRVVTGDGNNTAGTLPGVNDRNTGKVKIRRTFSPGASPAFTLLVKAAAGPRPGSRQFVELRAFGRRFAFGVDGVPGSPTYGKVTVVGAVGDTSTVLATIFDRTLRVAHPGTAGPHLGEFFTLRVVVKEDGTYRAYLNEDTVNYAFGSFAPTSATPADELQLTPIAGDDTMWFDSVQLLEGELPALCPDPSVDTNRDGRVDANDLMTLLTCSNGPGVPALSLPECTCMDADEDSDVDMVDFAVLQRCLNPTGPLDPACDD